MGHFCNVGYLKMKMSPGAGSTGDGYAMSARLGHGIVPPRPSLVPLLCTETDTAAERARERIRNRARFEKYNRCYAEAGWTV